MAGLFIFDASKTGAGFSTGTELALNVFLDILTDTLYYTDGSEIFTWQGGSTNLSYTWRSGKIRLPSPVNLGGALVEADSYNDVQLLLYADGVLKHTQTVADGEPFRLPGGYLSNIYEIELTGTDVVTGVSVAETIFELAAG